MLDIKRDRNSISNLQKQLEASVDKAKESLHQKSRERAELFRQKVIKKLQEASSFTDDVSSVHDGIPALIDSIVVKEQQQGSQKKWVVTIDDPLKIDPVTNKKIIDIFKALEYGTKDTKPVGAWRHVAARMNQ